MRKLLLVLYLIKKLMKYRTQRGEFLSLDSLKPYLHVGGYRTQPITTGFHGNQQTDFFPLKLTHAHCIMHLDVFLYGIHFGAGII